MTFSWSTNAVRRAGACLATAPKRWRSAQAASAPSLQPRRRLPNGLQTAPKLVSNSTSRNVDRLLDLTTVDISIERPNLSQTAYSWNQDRRNQFPWFLRSSWFQSLEKPNGVFVLEPISVLFAGSFGQNRCTFGPIPFGSWPKEPLLEPLQTSRLGRNRQRSTI